MTKEERMQMAQTSAMKIRALADVIVYEHQIVLKDFRGMPPIKYQGKHISNSAQEILRTLRANGMKEKSRESAVIIEEYTAELWETLDHVLQLTKEELIQLNAALPAIISQYKTNRNV